MDLISFMDLFFIHWNTPKISYIDFASFSIVLHTELHFFLYGGVLKRVYLAIWKIINILQFEYKKLPILKELMKVQGKKKKTKIQKI